MTLEAVPPYNEDLDIRPALPTVANLRTAIADSDGVVIATPEYNHGIPGVLKNALDWASRPAFNSCFIAKPVLIISSSPAFTGGVRAQYQLRETLASMHAHVVSGHEVVVAAVNSKTSQGAFTDVASLEFMANALARLRHDVVSRRRMAA
jgi:chromate reductase, NAD(P)H dehydrogenase (quinone)